MNAVVASPRANDSRRSRSTRKPRLVAGPNSLRALERRDQPGERRPRASRPRRSPWRAADRRTARSPGRQRCRRRRGCPRRPAAPTPAPCRLPAGSRAPDLRRTGVPRSRGRTTDVVLARPSGRRRRPQLQRDQVETGDQLRDRVLDLQPRVHLEEVELAAGVEQELDRAGAAIADAARRLDRAARPCARAAPASYRARRFLDRPSGAGAAPSSRAR